jgi:hypothetical protein
MLLDRMVTLLSVGCVVPVVQYVKQCWQRGDTDISLIRYFVTEVLEAIAPPYTGDFVQLFLPMVEHEEVTGTTRGDGENDPVSEFIGKYQINLIKIKLTLLTLLNISTPKQNIKSFMMSYFKLHFSVLQGPLHEPLNYPVLLI